MQAPQIEDWLDETAKANMLKANMLKAGKFEDLRTKRETMGGFVRAQISLSSFRLCMFMC